MKQNFHSLFPVETQKFLQLQSSNFADVSEIFKNIREIVTTLIEQPKSSQVCHFNSIHDCTNPNFESFVLIFWKCFLIFFLEQNKLFYFSHYTFQIRYPLWSREDLFILLNWKKRIGIFTHNLKLRKKSIHNTKKNWTLST